MNLTAEQVLILFLCPFLLFLSLIVVGNAYSAKVRTVLESVYPVWLALGIGLTMVLLWCVAVYEYLIFPGYLDHIQPTVAAVSWLAVHGHPIWPNWETGDIYAMIYGPLVYLVTGVFLLIDPSIFMSKLPGLVALLGAAICLWSALKCKKIDKLTAFLLIAALLVALDPRLTISYSNHSDPFLIFFAALTLPVAFEWPARRSAIGVGILAGICVGFKAHGFLYAVPAALAVLARAKDLREGTRFTVAGCGAALVAIALPFLLCQSANVDGYLRTMVMITNHGLSMEEFSSTIIFVIILAVSLFVVWHWWRPTLSRQECWFLIGLGGAVTATLIFGSKPGSGGARHIWPFYPICFYAMACILGAVSRAGGSFKPQNIMAIIVLALFIDNAGAQQASYVLMDYFYKRQDIELAKIADVENILKDYPDAQFGVSDGGPSYRDSYYRVLAVYQGAPLRLDIPVWFDLAFAGIPEGVAARMIELCAVHAWVLPLGEPFISVNGYTNQPLFSDEFRREFHNNYKLTQEDDFYQVWACK